MLIQCDKTIDNNLVSNRISETTLFTENQKPIFNKLQNSNLKLKFKKPKIKIPILDFNISNNRRSNDKKFMTEQDESRKQLLSRFNEVKIRYNQLYSHSTKNITHNNANYQQNKYNPIAFSSQQLEFREDVHKTINNLMENINRDNLLSLNNNYANYYEKKSDRKADNTYNIKKIDYEYYKNKLKYLTKDIWENNDIITNKNHHPQLPLLNISSRPTNLLSQENELTVRFKRAMFEKIK